MKRLYGTTDPAEAEAILVLLRDRGIAPILDRGEGPGPISIDIRDEDAAPAAEALAQHFERLDPRPPGQSAPEEPARGLWAALLRTIGLGKKKEPAP